MEKSRMNRNKIIVSVILQQTINIILVNPKIAKRSDNDVAKIWLINIDHNKLFTIKTSSKITGPKMRVNKDPDFIINENPKRIAKMITDCRAEKSLMNKYAVETAKDREIAKSAE